MTLAELTATIARAAQSETPYDGYDWDIDPNDILKLLSDRAMLVAAVTQALSKCNASGPVAIILRAALEQSKETWPNETEGLG